MNEKIYNNENDNVVASVVRKRIKFSLTMLKILECVVLFLTLILLIGQAYWEAFATLILFIVILLGILFLKNVKKNPIKYSRFIIVNKDDYIQESELYRMKNRNDNSIKKEN